MILVVRGLRRMLLGMILVVRGLRRMLLGMILVVRGLRRMLLAARRTAARSTALSVLVSQRCLIRGLLRCR
jgi:hypothetical protein